MSICLFLPAYILMPIVVRWTAARWMAALPGKLAGQFTGDIREYLKKARSGVLPELRGQVIAHLVEPWIDKFTDKCADVVASGSGRAIAEKYTEILVKAILKRKLLLSLLVSQLLTSAALFGYYLENLIK